MLSVISTAKFAGRRTNIANFSEMAYSAASPDFQGGLDHRFDSYTMTASTLQQFESQLEQFESACNHGATLTELLERLRDAVSVIAPKTHVKAGVVEGSRLIRISDHLSEIQGNELVAAFKTAQSRPQSDEAYFSDNSLLLSKPLSREHQLVIQFHTEDDPRRNSLLVDAARTLTDCFAAAVSRDLASKLYERIQDRELADPFLRELHAAVTFEQCARVIADRSTSLLSESRVSVLVFEFDQCRVVAATGVAAVDRTADAVRKIEALVLSALQEQQTGRWIETDQNFAQNSDQNPAAHFGKQLPWFAMNGIRTLRVEPLRSGPTGDKSSRTTAVLLEIFEGQSPPTDNRIEFLMTQAAMAIHGLPDAASSGVRIGWLRTTKQKTFLATLAAVMVLALFPADFEVEVSGQVFPVERYRVFAPDDGIVDQLAVNADDTVKSGQLLLTLRNAERTLEQSRLLGEIETTLSRLQAIRATRSSTGALSGNQNSRGVDLSSEELQLEQKLASLREEKLLVDQQLESLSLTSPIAGVVYQRRLRERLESRPVQRGQLLLEIVNSSSKWQLELQVPEETVGYVKNSADARDPVEVENSLDANESGEFSESSNVGQKVRFWLNSQRSHSFETQIDFLENAAHVDDQRLTCLATAPCQGVETQQLRPGQSVTARIHCGRRSLGFVLFREVIEYVQKKRFAWL